MKLGHDVLHALMSVELEFKLFHRENAPSSATVSGVCSFHSVLFGPRSASESPTSSNPVGWPGTEQGGELPYE